MAVVEPEHVAARLGRELTAAEEAAVPGIVAGVVGQTELALNRSIGARTVVEQVAYTDRSRVYLQESPVRSITSTVDALSGAVTAEVQRGAMYLPWFLSLSSWPLTVTYVAGYDDGDRQWPGIHEAILDWTVRELARVVSDGAPAVAQLAVEGETSTYLPKLARAEILDRLGRLQRPVVR